MTSLSPIDYYFYRRQLYTIQFVFEYRGSLGLGRIEQALRLAEARFPVFASRIVTGDEIRLQSGTGIPLREQSMPAARIDAMLDEVDNVPGAPLIKLVITHTPRGSFLGVSFSHLLGDGASFFLFLKALSDFCVRGDTRLTLVTDRSPLRSEARGHISRAELFRATGFVIPRPPPPLRSRVERISYSNDDLKALKADAAREGIQVSANDLIMATLLLRCHRELPLVGGRYLVRCPVDVRGIDPRLSPGYFGNAVKDALAFFEPAELRESSLAQIARGVRTAIAAVNGGAFQHSLDALERLRRHHGAAIFEKVGCPGLLVSNLSRFPVAEIDLGAGRPSGFHHASLNPRLAIVLPAENGVEIHVKRPLAAEAVATL